jgi:hypothetical protein
MPATVKPPSQSEDYGDYNEYICLLSWARRYEQIMSCHYMRRVWVISLLILKMPSIAIASSLGKSPAGMYGMKKSRH